MFLDTSVIIEIVLQGPNNPDFGKVLEHIKNETLFMSLIQVGEVSDVCIRDGVDPPNVLADLKEFINIVPLSDELCIAGAEIKHEMRAKGARKFGLMDGIALASARSMGQKLLTRDADFERAEDAVVLT